MVDIVIPTIAGREGLLEETVASFREQDATGSIFIVRNRRAIGTAWNEGMATWVDQGKSPYVLLAADDILAFTGALEEGAHLVAKGALPSPHVVNSDGSLHSCGSFGGGMLIPEVGYWVCASSPFPMLNRELWEEIGSIPDIHYYADDFIGWKLRQSAVPVISSPLYKFTHLEGVVGRDRVAARAHQDKDEFIRSITSKGEL